MLRVMLGSKQNRTQVRNCETFCLCKKVNGVLNNVFSML